MTAERYTAVFTGLFNLKEPGEYPYLIMGENPLASGTYELRRGRPPYAKMGNEIAFEYFPEGCRQLVLDTYLGLWDL